MIHATLHHAAYHDATLYAALMYAAERLALDRERAWTHLPPTAMDIADAAVAGTLPRVGGGTVPPVRREGEDESPAQVGLNTLCYLIADGPQEFGEANTPEGWQDVFLARARSETRMPFPSVTGAVNLAVELGLLVVTDDYTVELYTPGGEYRHRFPHGPEVALQAADSLLLNAVQLDVLRRPGASVTVHGSGVGYAVNVSMGQARVGQAQSSRTLAPLAGVAAVLCYAEALAALPTKGSRGGRCNRTACQKPGATMFNTSTRAWYCPACAESINRWSRLDSKTELCVTEEAYAQAYELAPATAELVDQFAQAVKDKLLAAQRKYGYSTEWQAADWQAECQQELLGHLLKGDPRDVAAYAAFSWRHGWSTRGRAAEALMAAIDADVAFRAADADAVAAQAACVEQKGGVEVSTGTREDHQRRADTHARREEALTARNAARERLFAALRPANA